MDKTKIPKLVELYQFPGYDKFNKKGLPYDINFDDTLQKVLDSIDVLQKQVKL